MSEPITINTPLEGDFYLQLGEIYSTTLKNDERLTLKILNPNLAKVICEVEAGAGEVSLYKNGRRVLALDETYSLSTEPGYLTTVSLNTHTTPDEDTERVIKVDKSDFDEASLKRSLAIKYSVREKDIEIKELQKAIKATIPDSIWELYIASGADKSTFRVTVQTTEE